MCLVQSRHTTGLYLKYNINYTIHKHNKVLKFQVPSCSDSGKAFFQHQSRNIQFFKKEKNVQPICNNSNKSSFDNWTNIYCCLLYFTFWTVNFQTEGEQLNNPFSIQIFNFKNNIQTQPQTNIILKKHLAFNLEQEHRHFFAVQLLSIHHKLPAAYSPTSGLLHCWQWIEQLWSLLVTKFRTILAMWNQNGTLLSLDPSHPSSTSCQGTHATHAPCVVTHFRFSTKSPPLFWPSRREVDVLMKKYAVKKGRKHVWNMTFRSSGT